MTTTTDPALTPGAMLHYKSRELYDGALIEFEFAPAGFLKKDGEPRRADWRAYHVTEPGGKRTRKPSVTTLLDAIIPKPGIAPWAEARGIEGAIEAVRRGDIDPATVLDPVDAVRALRLGADAQKEEAATRGLNVHDLLERYMLDGSPPNPASAPPAHAGYIRALAMWLVKARPEPTQVEQLVYSARHGYAGRLDLRCVIDGADTLVDLKTQANAGIYEGAHVQTAMYRLAAEECGDPAPERTVVVVLAENGAFREMDCLADEDAVAAALKWCEVIRPIQSACASLNRVEREARKAAA